MIMDSNIVIYAERSEHGPLRQFIVKHLPSVSAITVVEVLGFHKIGGAERQYFERMFRTVSVLPVSDQVIDRAVSLRQNRKMSLGDALIGATALVFGRTLVTGNVRHFDWIQGLTLLNPLPPTAEIAT